jgi:hypothetical protein
MILLDLKFEEKNMSDYNISIIHLVNRVLHGYNFLNPYPTRKNFFYPCPARARILVTRTLPVPVNFVPALCPYPYPSYPYPTRTRILLTRTLPVPVSFLPVPYPYPYPPYSYPYSSYQYPTRARIIRTYTELELDSYP